MKEPRHRLVEARQAKGFETASDAWRANKQLLGKDLLISNENGNRPISRKAAEKYAKAFDVDAGWILFGEGRGPNQPEEWKESLDLAVEKARTSGASDVEIFLRLHALAPVDLLGTLSQILAKNPNDLQLLAEKVEEAVSRQRNPGGGRKGRTEP
jgi:hypothetical protein